MAKKDTSVAVDVENVAAAPAGLAAVADVVTDEGGGAVATAGASSPAATSGNDAGEQADGLQRPPIGPPPPPPIGPATLGPASVLARAAGSVVSVNPRVLEIQTRLAQIGDPFEAKNATLLAYETLKTQADAEIARLQKAVSDLLFDFRAQHKAASELNGEKIRLERELNGLLEQEAEAARVRAAQAELVAARGG